MDNDSPLTSRKGLERVAREQRLANALRENLRRRKERARAQEKLRVPRKGNGRGTAGTPLA
jgi:hypothetical protein